MEDPGDGKSGIAVPATFVRFDRPELKGTTMVVRGIPSGTRENRRHDSRTPLGYLYDRVSEFSVESDLEVTAGHFDEARLVWVFSGEITGIAGLTEPLRAADLDSPSD